jgi:hypothetical protein
MDLRCRQDAAPTARAYNRQVKTLCDGSRRPVRGARHHLKTSPSGHMKARCPVCRRVLVVSRVLGIVEFPRHEAK